MSEDEPNPDYLRGTERELYQFFNDFLPTGQAVNISGQGELSQSPGLLAAYSASIIIVSTGVGMFVFKKKDINRQFTRNSKVCGLSVTEDLTWYSGFAA